MVRISDSFPLLLGLIVAAVGFLTGCFGTGQETIAIDDFDPTGEAIPGVEAGKSKPKKEGWLFGRKKGDRSESSEASVEPESSEKPESPQSPKASGPQRPRRISMGQVHMVHAQGRFVLIQAAQMKKVPPEAELMTYSPQGRPTGKLRISPEKKGNFFVADILKGKPQPGDKVMVFGMEGPDGQLVFGGNPDPDAEEVLE